MISVDFAGFWGTAYAIFGPFVRPFEGYFSDLKAQLPKAGLRVTIQAYLAGSLLAGILTGLGGAVMGSVGSAYLFGPSAFVLLGALGTGSLVFATTLSVFYFVPTFLVGSRMRKLDAELPFSAGHMSVLSTAGMTPERIFHAIAQETPGGIVSGEARLIVRDMAMLGSDLNSALRSEVARSPSKAFSEFLDGFISASTSGADLNNYLTRAASGLMLERRLKARAVGETAAVAGEVYTIVLVVAPLMLLIMFSLIGTIIGNLGGISVIDLMNFIAYFVVPVGGISALLVADAVVGGTA